MKKVLIDDVSLRALKADGNATFSFKEKLEIARRLSELGADVIEVAPSFNDKADEILVKTICAVVTRSVVSCVAGNTEKSVEKAYSLISGAAKKRLLVAIPVSPVQMEYFYGKKPAAVLELLSTLTAKAVSLCKDVEVSLEDATRAEPEFLYSAVKAAIAAGAKTVAVTDLAGMILPHEFEGFISDIYKNVPELKEVKLSVQCSDELSMGTATALSALGAGADCIKVAAVENSGAPSVYGITHAIEYIGNKKGFTCGINRTAINRIVSGINNIASQKFSDARRGNGEAENVGEGLSLKELSEVVDKYGYELSAEDMKKVYEEYCRLSEKKQVSAKELDVIIATSALQVPSTYTLVNFSVHSSNVLSATASVILNKGDEELRGISFGNGPVDAAFLAIENVIGRHFELDSFELGAVTEGKEALGQAMVKLRNKGILYSGRGISTDIIGASIRAYIAALNKIVYEEANR